MGPFDPKFQVEGGVPHQPFYVSESVCELPFTWYKNLGGTFVRFVTIHAVTDRQTDVQTDTFAIGKTGCILQRGKNDISYVFWNCDGDGDGLLCTGMVMGMEATCAVTDGDEDKCSSPCIVSCQWQLSC